MRSKENRGEDRESRGQEDRREEKRQRNKSDEREETSCYILDGPTDK